MKRLRFTLSLLIIFTATSFSQNKLLSIEDVTVNSYSRLQPKNLNQLNWIPNSDKFAWIDGKKEKSSLVFSSVKSAAIDTILTNQQLNLLLSKINCEAAATFPRIEWINSEQFNFWNHAKYFSFNIKTKDIKVLHSLPENTEDRFVSPDYKAIAFTVGNNLYMTMQDQKYFAITSESDTNIVNGQVVHRNEFGIDKGIFWSPKSNFIAYYRMDQTMVTDYPLVDVTFTPARLKNIKYPMTGQASHHVTIGIFDINNNKTVWLKTGEPLDQYLTNVSWSPDEKYIYVAHLNRDQNHLEWKQYNASDGEYIKTLFEEKSEKYVEPLVPLTFLPNSSKLFIWQSQRDRYNHLYLFDTEGNLIKQLTRDQWVVTSFNGFDKKGENIFFTSTKESPLEKNFYRVNIETGELVNLTAVKGTHRISINSDSDYFIDSYSNISTPRIINLIDQKGKVVRNLLTSENPLSDFSIGKTNIIKLKNDDGIDLYCRMITPPDFDSTKKYPVIVYVYGGPHDQEVTNSFGYGKYFLWFYLMAQKGFIVFTLDNRGSFNRGLDFEQATFRHLGTIEVKDQMTGVNYLKSLPYIDSNRFGVYGWSYGGFMATSLMLRSGNTFKVAVGGGSVIDWKYYEVMYGERYMDTPQSNPDGYAESSLLNYVNNLKGKLFLCNGTSDPTVVWQNSLMFIKKCEELNKPIDYLPYIGHEHGVIGRDATHLYEKITNYFLDNM